MEVYYWKGDWGLPTIDVDCLEVIAYVKFADAPVTLTPSSTPVVNHRVAEFPMLKTTDGQYEVKAKRIIKYFEEMKFFADKWMESSQMQDILAMKALVMDKLRPCMFYHLWLDPDSYGKVTSKAYSKKCTFPLNYFIPGRQLRSAEHFIHYTKVPKNGSLDDIKEQLHADAAECLNSLSSFLGKKEYFFGDRPCSFDALAFAHLAVLNNVPFVNTKLQNHLKGCENLLRYITRVLRAVRLTVPDMKEPTTTTTPTTTKSSSEETSSITNWLVPLGVAVIAMSSYAVHIGLLAVRES